jgi:hypothetical protein
VLEKKTTPPEEGTALETILKDEDFLTPAEQYRKNLEKHKISLEDATTIYDGVLTKGYYEEYVRLKGNHRAVFRSRKYEDHLRLQTLLEMQKPQLAISQDEIISRMNLASSLYEWEGEVLKHETDDDFDAVMKIIMKLPAPIFSVLVRELSKFDEKIFAVFSEGAEENF